MAMSDNTATNEERPCLHCLIGDVIDDFYAEYCSLSGEKDAIDVDEIITALAKTVAELTFGLNAPNSLGLLTESEVMAMPRSLAASSVARCPGGPMALVGLTRTVTRAVVGTASLSSCSRRP